MMAEKFGAVNDIIAGKTAQNLEEIVENRIAQAFDSTNNRTDELKELIYNSSRYSRSHDCMLDPALD